MEDSKMTKEFDARITALDAEIAGTQSRLRLLETRRATAIADRAKAIATGKTTSGDHIRDLVLRIHCTPDESLEKRLRTVESRFAGKVGDIALFTFSRNLVTSRRRGGPGDSHNEYSFIWYIACGIVADERLRIESGKITFPINRYVVGQHAIFADAQFAVAEDPFTRKLEIDERKSHYGIDDYARPERDVYGELFLIIGDAEVRAWMDSKRQYKGQFKICCNLLSKLILEPTDE